MTKMLIATQDAFDKNATYIPRGKVIPASQVDWKAGDPGFIEAPEGVDGSAVVEVSAIAPTGPNPQNPQQVPVGVVQTAAGYEQDGAVLVGEVTVPEKERLADRGIDKDDDTQAKVSEALAGTGEAVEDDLTGTKANLVAIAEAEGVELETDDNKASIATKIRAHRATS